MPSSLYIITFSRDRWWIDTDGRQHGPHGSRAEAISSAIEAAYVFGEPGVSIEVVAPNSNNRYRVIWRSTKDPYPPPSWVLDDEDGPPVPALSIDPEPAFETVPSPDDPVLTDEPSGPGLDADSADQSVVPPSDFAPYPETADPGLDAFLPLETLLMEQDWVAATPDLPAPAAEDNVRSRAEPQTDHLPESEAMSTEDLLMTFQLTRDTIAGWSAEAVHYLAAATAAEENGDMEPGILASAERSIVAIHLEIEGLTEAARQTEDKSDDLMNGIAAAVSEMENLVGAIGGAVARLQQFA